MSAKALATCLLLLASVAVTGCGDILGVACTQELRPNLKVEVRVAGEPAALGATGLAEHDGGVVTELAASDSLSMSGSWDRELAGRYAITVRKPGYRTELVRVRVDEDRCHVKTERVQVSLTADPAAVPVSPLVFERGDRVAGSEASVGVEVLGDTLVLAGRAVALCDDLAIVAFRSGDAWHIQLQPADWDFPCSGVHGMQQFEARFTLLSGPNHILLTHAVGGPAELFSDYVSPQ